VYVVKCACNACACLCACMPYVCLCDTMYDDVTLCMMAWHYVWWRDTMYDDVTLCLCVHVWHTYACVCMQYIRMHVCAYARMCVCMYAYVCPCNTFVSMHEQHCCRTPLRRMTRRHQRLRRRRMRRRLPRPSKDERGQVNRQYRYRVLEHLPDILNS